MRTIFTLRFALLACLLVPAAWLTGCQRGNPYPPDAAAQPVVDAPPATANRAPVTIADTKVADGGPLSIAVLANDSDPDSDALRLTAAGSASHGSVRIDDAGTPGNTGDDVIVYTPEPGYVGDDAFEYTVEDTAGARAAGSVTVLAMPAAADKFANTMVNTPVVIDVLDLDGFGIDSFSIPAFGNVTVDERGTPADATDDQLVYTPAFGYVGPDTFLYTISGPGGADTAGVTVGVTASPSAAVTSNVSGQVLKGPIRDAVVRLYEMGPDGSRVGVPVATVTTDGLGRWQATAPTPRTDLLVIASGGRYNDETNTTGTQRTVELTAADELIAVMPADEDVVISSVYSYSLYLRARRAAGGADFIPAYADVRSEATAAWDLDLTTTPATDPSAPDPGMPMDSRRHALALGGAANALATVVSRLGLARPDGPTIRALARDLANCGLDGRDANGIIYVPVRGVQRPMADNIDLNREILRFRNNRSDQYGATELPVWSAPLCVASEPPADDRAPIVTVDVRQTGATSPALSGRIDDPDATVEVTVDGRSYAAVNLGNAWLLPENLITPPLVNGVYNVRVSATDFAGNVGIDTTSTDLVIDTNLPSVSIDPGVSADGSPALGGSVSDPSATVWVTIDGDNYVTTVNNNEWTLAPGTISPNLPDGNYDATVTATVGGDTATVNQSAAVTVDPNTPPTFSLSGDVTVDEDFSGARVVSVIADPVPADETDQIVRYRLQPASADFADVTISPSSGRVTIVAQANAFGTQTFFVTANDGQPSASVAAASFTLTVNPVNDAPTFALSGDILESQDFVGERRVSVTPLNTPGDEINQTVSYTLSPASVSFADVTADGADGTVRIISIPGASGSQVFMLTATDDQGATSAANFTLTVNPVSIDNVVPVITGQATVTTSEENPLTISLAQLVVSDTDNVYPDDFSLGLQPGPNYVIAGTTVTPAVDFNGVLAVPVTVSDGASTSAQFNLAIDVLPINDPPQFTLSGNVVEVENFTGSRVISVTPGPVPADEASQDVTYALQPATVPFAGIALDPATGGVTITATTDASGSQVFSLTADDGQSLNNTVSQSFTLTVVGSDNPPTTVGIADISTIDSGAIDVIDLFGAFDDTEDDDADMTYAVAANTDPSLFDALAIDPVGGTLTIDFAEGVSGTATLTISATDTDGNAVTTDTNVSLNPEADLRIASFSVNDASPGFGAVVNITMVVQNQGPSAATDVFIDVPLPAGYVYVGANNPAEYNQATGQWYRSRINGTSTLVLMAEVQSSGPYDLVAQVASMNELDPDSTPGNGDAGEDDYATVTISPRPVTDVTLSIVVDDPIPAPDGTVTLTVAVENAGPINANGIRVSLPPLPGQLVYESASPGIGSFNRSTGLWRNVSVPWSGDPLAPQSATLTVTARVRASVPVSTVLQVDAQIIQSNQVDPDGVESDAAAMLVLEEGIDHEWVGGAGPDPTDWHNPANWDTGMVPSPGDNVTIPPTANDPVLGADTLGLALLDIESGAAVYANGFTLTSRGDLDAQDGPIVGPGEVHLEWGNLRGTVPNLVINVLSPAGEVELNGDLVVAGDLVISRGRLDVESRTVAIAGNLTATGEGLLVQKSGVSEIIVAGNVLFDGGDYATKIGGKFPLRDGVIYIGGDFTQAGDPRSFAAENNHLVVFNGSGPQTISMQDPDNSNPGSDTGAASGSRFANLRLDKDYAVQGAVTLLSDVAVLKTLEQPEGGIPKLRAAPGSGHTLIVGGLDIDTPPYPLTDSIVFDNVPLLYVEGTSHHHLEGAVFTNMDPGVAQITVSRDKLENGGRLFDVRFETLPDYAAGGRYIVLDNIDDDPTKNITLDVRESLPQYGLPMTETIGNATIEWGSPGADSDRDGILDEDEYAAGTNPVFGDSDFDGLDDPDELAAGTQPLNQDTDGDGIGDGAETAAGGNPLVAAPPGTVLYVRPAPLGDDANSGFGGWSDALATNAAVEAALIDGIAPDQPTYVLYAAGTFSVLAIDRIDNVALIGSLGPGIAAASTTPTTVFDASTTPDVAVVEIGRSQNIRLQSLTLRGADNDGGGEGGGLYVDDRSSVIVHDAIIEDNVASDIGGGAFVDDGGWLSLIDSVVRNNTASSWGGGGVGALGGLTLLRSTLVDNRYMGDDDNGGGGALLLEPGDNPVDVRDSRFLSNISATNGGAIWISLPFAPITVNNNLVVGNVAEAGVGGGIGGDRLDRGFPTLIESNTIAFNSALDDASAAGGVHLDRADDVHLRDNVIWRNTDADTFDELQDQFVDDGASALLEYNSIEDFGEGDLSGNDDDNPKFEFGFYLRSDSGVRDNGSRNAIDAGLGAPYTTSVDGAADTLVLDQGFHYAGPADGEAYAAVLAGEAVDCATDTLTLRFVLPGVGGDLGDSHIVAVRQDGDDTAGGSIVTRSEIEPYSWSNSRLAIDESDGVYRLDIVGVSHGAGENAVINIRVDNDQIFDLSSTDLSVLFGGSGC